MRRAALLVALVGALAATAASTAAPGQALRVLYIGDSLTTGAIATGRAHSFPYLVTGALERQGKTVAPFVVAKGGVRTAYWHAGAIPRSVDIAVVELGTNDVSDDPDLRPGVAPPAFDAHYRNLLAMIRAKSPHARMVCLSVWRPDHSAAEVSGYNDVIRRDCGGQYVNIERFAHAPNLASLDRFHPNDAGHALIAKAILIALQAH